MNEKEMKKALVGDNELHGVAGGALLGKVWNTKLMEIPLIVYLVYDSLTVWQSELTVSLSVNSLCQLFNCPVNVVVLVCHPLAEVGISPVYALSLVWPYPLTGFCRSTYRDAQWGLTAVIGCGTDGV